MLLLALVLGLRRDELRHLTWSRVNLETGEMGVPDEKTKGHVQPMHLPENLLHVLEQHALHQKHQNRKADTAKPHLGLVFPDNTGGELSKQAFLQAWYACCEDVGLPRLHFHDLRVLVWRRLLLQERKGRDGQAEDCHNDTRGEEPNRGHT